MVPGLKPGAGIVQPLPRLRDGCGCAMAAAARADDRAMAAAARVGNRATDAGSFNCAGWT